MDLVNQASILEATGLAEAAFSAMDSTGVVAADKTPSPGTGSEFLVDEEAASTCPLLTPSPPAAGFHISLSAVDRPPGMAYEQQISPSITDPELSSSMPGLNDTPAYTNLSDSSMPAHDSSPAMEDGPSVAFPGVVRILDSSSSSSSVLHEPTACVQLLNSHLYTHLPKGSDVAAFVCQENGGKSPLSAIQLFVPPSVKDYPFLNWNWRLIRCASFVGATMTIMATICVVIAILIGMPKSCKPTHEWWQGTLFYEIFPASFKDSDTDGVGDFRGMLQQMEYLDNLGVNVVHLNSIFAADHYPEHFAQPRTLMEIDHSLGNLTDFQAIVRSLHKLNMSLVLDIPVGYEAYTLKYGEITVSEEKTDIIAESLEFWLNQGVDGFYLKGLEHIVHEDDFSDRIKRWRRLVDKFGNRILMCSVATINSLKFDSDIENIVLNRMDLVDVYVNISSDHVADEINGHFQHISREKPNYPWIHWNMGSVESGRLANHLQTSNGSLAALLFNLMLPGTPSIFYGDEIGLENYNNIEELSIIDHPLHINHPPQVVVMHWTEGPSLGFTTSKVLPWVYPSESYTTVSKGFQRAIKVMSDLRSDSPVIYMNGIWKDGKILPNYKIRYMDRDIAVMERTYPRRRAHIAVSNFSPHKQIRDLSHIYYGGTIKVDLLGRTGQFITFHSLVLYPGETIVLQLDK